MVAESVTCRAVVAGRHGEPDVLAVRTWAVPTAVAALGRGALPGKQIIAVAAQS